MTEADLSGKLMVVTGANSGIGYQTALALARMGATIAMFCRSPDKGEAARERLAEDSSTAPELFICDFSEPASIREAAACFRSAHDRLDVLVNNAGGYQPERRENSLGHELTFAVNHLGYFLLTHLLLPPLRAAAPSRIVSVASTAHRRGIIDFEDLQRTRRAFTGMAAYSDSKLANILFNRELARRLEGSGVTANCLHPGVVRTEFGQDEPGWMNRLFRLVSPFFLSAEDGASTSVHLAAAPEVTEQSGHYWVRRRIARPRSKAEDDKVARRLWAVSEELVGLSPSEHLSD